MLRLIEHIPVHVDEDEQNGKVVQLGQVQEKRRVIRCLTSIGLVVRSRTRYSWNRGDHPTDLDDLS